MSIEDLYKKSDFVQNLISNIEMSLFKSDMNIAKLYVDSLLEKENLLFKDLLKEAKLTEQMILKIKNAPRATAKGNHARFNGRLTTGQRLSEWTTDHHTQTQTSLGNGQTTTTFGTFFSF